MGGNVLVKGRDELSTRASGASDDELIARLRNRDVRAFEELYRNYHRRLTRFLLNMIHRPQLVEEVFNDTMMVVWNKPESFNGASKLSTWIFGIAYRKGLKALRHWDDPAEDDSGETRVSSEPSPEQQADHARLHEKLRSAMDHLSADHRAVVDLTYFHEFGYREISEIMACPVDTVKTRMFHARRHMKRVLAGDIKDWL